MMTISVFERSLISLASESSMPPWEIAVISCIWLYALAFFLLFGPIVAKIYDRRLANMSTAAERWIKNHVGLYVAVCGNIRAGKTTFSAALANVFSKIKMQQAIDKLDEVKKALPDVDFNVIDYLINQAFYIGHLTNADAIISFLFASDKSLSTQFEGRFYYDYLWPVSWNSLLRDYINASVALLRNNYVYFLRRKFYCRVTNTWAMNYLPSMINIKDRYDSKDFVIQHYSVVFEDEKVLSGKSNLDYNQVASEDGGGSEFLRLLGQLYRETVHYIITAQDYDAVVKEERRLVTGVWYIRDRIEIPRFSLKSIFVDIAYDFLSRLKLTVDGSVQAFRHGRYASLQRRSKRYIKAGHDLPERLKIKLEKANKNKALQASKIRVLLSALDKVKKRDFADSFIRYKGDYWTTASDVGKAPGQCKGQFFKTDLCVPLSFAYGSINTFAFSDLSDYLSVNSVKKQDFLDPDEARKIPFESDEDFEAYMKFLLRKRQSKRQQRSGSG